MKNFQYYRPATAEQAVGLLEQGAAPRPVAAVGLGPALAEQAHGVLPEGGARGCEEQEGCGEG